MASKRKALGKGLSALINEEFDKIDENSIVNIGVDLIKSNPLQPRKNFDEEKIDELSKSIERHGVIQPVIVKKSGMHYQLIAGERRWRAARQAGLKEIPSIVRDIDNRSQEEIALIENIQREDLNSIDEAVAYKVVMDRYDITQEEVSTMVGKSRVYVTNIMRLLKLPDYVQKYIMNGDMTTGHGKALAGIGEKEIKAVTDRILKEDLSVRETEKIVRELKNGKKDENKKVRKNEKEPNILHIEEVLMNELGTKVEINKRKKSGKIQLFFSNDEELQRILNIISDKLS
ncbi:chromosome partitioning protein, ParB family [Dethiosulfatibacter aminovorans DSM 17477]|uniref:Chromosome partitioning protein, ParB family n=1 Tax=Dethiosulfatibacter aminovorans DSM 17477 TaxID=1121476 RepID=A0A1M6AKJ9_9FIRM|nr:ParB/RepB/Spo0J family partition protein [Dethiosulfatibacter aminovorans]SHI36985.1 chromosome partitioning protein, ParB family [Dethiosulfatibacter aminovorans DSM 17477]